MFSILSHYDSYDFQVVQLRNEVIECLEMDRLREAEEDQVKFCSSVTGPCNDYKTTN